MRKNRLTWQEALSDLITDPQELFALLELDLSSLTAAQLAARAFKLKVPRRYVARMQKANPYDPLLLQVLPLGVELDLTPGYEVDPLAEKAANPVPGLLHKYANRVLVTLTSACAVHCRFCFRRHFPYEENNPGKQGWEKIMAYIQQNKMINEVILSGGDPLTVSDHLLQQFSQQLLMLRQVKRLRIHTRLPVVLPERVTPELLHWIKTLNVEVVVVIHANHPNEINEEVKLALLQLHAAGAQLLNQTVLLKGINDNAATLAALSEKLFSAKVLPYYLHVLDKVQGAAHFDLPRATAQTLYKELCAELPGYLVPRLVCEEPRQLAKTLIRSELE
jgi:EF-P beta-lysylation protein EpmB